MVREADLPPTRGGFAWSSIRPQHFVARAGSSHSKIEKAIDNTRQTSAHSLCLHSNTMEPVGWADMLQVLLVAIAGHMSYETICAASTVCRNWQQVFGELEWENPVTFVAKHPHGNLIHFLESHKHQLQNVIIEYTPGQPKGTWGSYQEVLAALVGAANLHSLTLMTEGNSRILPHGLELFTDHNWPALKHLVLYRPRTSLGFKQLCQNMAPQLVSLELCDCNPEWCTETPWGVLEKLTISDSLPSIVPQIVQTPFESLTHLSLNGCLIGDIGFESIVRWTQFSYLEKLDLSGNKITKKGIRTLKDLLDDRLTPIDSESNPWRGYVERLVELDLSNNLLTKRSLDYFGYITLPHFSGLTKLNITGIRMSKQAIDFLCACEFADQLSELVLGKGDISAKQLERLYAKLPTCHIVLA